MEMTATHEITLTIEELQKELRDCESRMGLATDLRAGAVRGVEKTISRHNILADPPSVLVLVAGTANPPAGANLDFAGTAFVEGKKQIVAVYR